MNYKPFSELETGAIFCDVEHRDLVLMKTSYGNFAMLLESRWIDNKLLPRGKLIEYDKKECIVEVDDGDLVVPAKRTDPIDPRRKFWKTGDTQVVGRELAARIEVFAGLFLYSGFGMGNYYSATDNETFWCGATEARSRAESEGVLYVYYDSKDWTKDPTLAFEKEEARRRRDEAAAAAAQQTAQVAS